MEKTLENFGPCIVNDITGAEAEPEIAGVAARYRVPFIAMHMRGTPQNMQSRTHYDDLIGEIRGYFAQKPKRCAAPESTRSCSTGFGFQKPSIRISCCSAGWAKHSATRGFRF